MKARQIMHPADAKALQVLKQARGFNTLIKYFMQVGDERIMRGENLGTMLRVSPDNLPKVYTAFQEVVNCVGIDEPELYIYNDPVMNAYTYGDTRIFVALSSSLVERLTLPELKSIMAHECGHILCRHTLYKTVLHIIEDMGKAAQVITGSLAFPAYCALQYWNRMSEYSADRCAAAVVGEQVFQSALLKLTSGLSDIQGDPYQLVKQGKRYYEMKNASFFDRVQQACREMFYSHPQDCQRAYEIDRWKSSANYRTLTKDLTITNLPCKRVSPTQD